MKGERYDLVVLCYLLLLWLLCTTPLKKHLEAFIIIPGQGLYTDESLF